MRRQSFWKKCVCLLLAVAMLVGTCISMASCDDGKIDDEASWIGPY